MNKKGFTLIELLAVIVILAIIALIATPVVLNIIEDSKESAAKDSAMVIAKAAETYYVSNATLEGEKVGEIYLNDGTLQYKGEKPDKGYVTFDEKGNAYLKMYMNGYCIISDYDNMVVSEKMENEECMLPNEVPLVFNDGDKVYFNPVKNIACKETDYKATTNSKNGFRGTEENGCLLWRAFLDTEEAKTVKLILDHNTSTSTLTWEDGKAEIANAKNNNLYGWHEEVRSTIRIIDTPTELHKIAPYYDGGTSWYYFHTGTHTSYSGAAGTNKYGWLFDNTEGCEAYGCNIEQDGQDGYWGSSETGFGGVWFIQMTGGLSTISATYSYGIGVRPVIEVSKTKLSN